MGSAEMRDAFNSVSAKGQASAALQWYERDDAGKEWQVLSFRGNRPDGSAFVANSERHDPKADPVGVARETAQKFNDTDS